MTRSLSRLLLFLLALVSVGGPAVAQSRTVVMDSYPSALLGVSRTVRLVLPDPLPAGEKLPVLVMNDGQ